MNNKLLKIEQGLIEFLLVKDSINYSISSMSSNPAISFMLLI